MGCYRYFAMLGRAGQPRQGLAKRAPGMTAAAWRVAKARAVRVAASARNDEVAGRACDGIGR
jgi:hypothetical protein